MRKDRILSVFRKELREIVRDRKTVFLMLAMPLIVYPLLIIGISAVFIRVENNYESTCYSVAVEESVPDEIRDILSGTLPDVDYSFDLFSTESASDAVTDGSADAGLFADGTDYVIVYNSSDQYSSYASDYLFDQLYDYQTVLTENMLEDAGMDADAILYPISVDGEDLASGEESVGSILGMIVPLLLIMGVFLGVMTPAVDVTAGEKERGTQETLMSLPLKGQELICGKYLAVSASGAVSALLYLASVGILGVYIYSLAGSYTDITLDLTAFLPSLLVTVVTILAFALFLGAGIMCVCTFAKSTKEASNYISPIMLIIMLVSYAGYLNVHLTVPLSIVPVLNIVLLIKSVLQFEYDATAIVLVLLSNIAYATVAITILGKLYTSERILFGESEGSLLERNTSRLPGALPKTGDGILVLAIAAVLYLYLGSLLQVKYLLAGVGGTQIILLAVPLLAAWYGRVDCKATFSLHKPALRAVPAAVLLAIGGYVLCYMLCQPIAGLAGESTEIYTDAVSQILDGPSLWMKWLVIGLAPAICEETLFRGYFMASLRKTVKPWLAIGITALLFGIYHMNLYQGCYAFLLGLILGYTVYRSGSIVLGALIHFLCNSITVFLSTYSDALTEWLPILNEPLTAGRTILLGAAGAAVTAAGILLLRGKRKNT